MQMLEIATDKLTERERECLKHIRQGRERGVSFAQYCRSAGLKANEWHAVRHGMVKKRLLPPGPGARTKVAPSRRGRDAKHTLNRNAAFHATLNASDIVDTIRNIPAQEFKQAREHQH